jgi:hypothetical protein
MPVKLIVIASEVKPFMSGEIMSMHAMDCHGPSGFAMTLDRRFLKLNRNRLQLSTIFPGGATTRGRVPGGG